MKFDRVVGFGDSWIWGDELLDPGLVAIQPDVHASDPRNRDYRENNCFLGLVAQHYGVPARNFGWPGSSIKSTVWTYLWWLENCPDEVANSLVLVGLTNSYRHSFYNPRHQSRSDDDPPWNRFVHDQWIRSAPHLFDESWQDLARLHISLTHSDMSDRRGYQEAAWFFHGQHLAQNNMTLQFNIVDPPCAFDLESFVMPRTSLQHYLRDFSDVFAPGRHPNLSGHEVISKKLILEIDRAILE